MPENEVLNNPTETDVTAEAPVETTETTKKTRKPRKKSTPKVDVKKLQQENECLKRIIEQKSTEIDNLTKELNNLCRAYSDKTEYAMDVLSTAFKSVMREFKGGR